MSADDNRRLIEDAMTALAAGDSGPYYALWDETDFVFRPMGSGRWARAYEGKETARDELFRPLRRQYADAPRITATTITAAGDLVVVEADGYAPLKAGGAYENRYCFVIRMAGGKVKEVREYFDTALSEALLGPLT